ncbi:co-chaperone protein Sba1p [Monosporozyma servazzii]
MSTTALLPKVEWAQRSNETDPEKNYILLTIHITDCEDPVLDIQPTYLDLTAKSKGHVGDEVTHEYKLHIDFFKEIVPDKTLHKKANGQHYFLKMFKKDLQIEYWPRLTKEKVKYNNIKTDFDKWVDEDEQDEVPEENEMPGMDAFGAGGPGGPGGPGGMDMAEMLKNMGGAGGAGGPGGMDMAEMLKGMGGAGAGGPGGMDMAEMLKGMGGAGAGGPGGMDMAEMLKGMGGAPDAGAAAGGADLKDMLSGDKAKEFEELMKQMKNQDGASADHNDDEEADGDDKVEEIN